MRRVPLDGARWRHADDLWTDLLTALEAPDWHGRNLDALWDSLTGGQINGVATPFALLVRNTSSAPHEVARQLIEIAELFDEASEHLGVPIKVIIE
jgi:RNAse (barnase) inhibitor barstar